MAKFCGIIGYALTVETEPGIYEEKIIENQYFGDVIRNSMIFSSYIPGSVSTVSA